MGGGDFSPITELQIMVASLGVFMAAIINANIFGELQILLNSIGMENQVFDLKKSLIDTAMINLKLPLSLKVKVRGQLYQFSPLEIN